MTQTQGTKKQPKNVPATTPVIEDFSRLINQSVDKLANEEVKTVHLFGSFYRCNWWTVDPSTESLFIRSGRISRSQFMRATRTESGVRIEDVPNTSTSRS